MPPASHDDPADPSDSSVSAYRPLTQVDLNLLVPLRALLDEGSVTRAARRVGISQPAMSHCLKRCRRLLGDELLVRVGSALELTARARELRGPLDRVLREIDAAVLHSPGFIPARSNRVFRVAATSTTTLVVMPPLIRRVLQLAPQLVVDVVPSVERGEDLLELPGVDVALIAEPLPSELPRERLYQDRWVAVVAPDNPAVGDELTLEQLSQLPHAVFDTPSHYGRLPPYAELDRQKVPYLVRLRVQDFVLLPLVLGGTNLVAIAQERVTARLAAAGLVRIFPLPLQVPPLGIDAVWNPRDADDPARAWFRELLFSVVEPLPQ